LYQEGLSLPGIDFAAFSGSNVETTFGAYAEYFDDWC
jgi:hypothetical protein